MYKLVTQPARDVKVYLGGGETINLIWGFESSIIKQDSVSALENVSLLGESALEFTGGQEDLHVGIKTSGTLSLESYGVSNSYAVASIPNGSGYILTGFSEDPGDLRKLMKMDGEVQREKVKHYYTNLMQSFTVGPVQNFLNLQGMRTPL